MVVDQNSSFRNGHFGKSPPRCFLAGSLDEFPHRIFTLTPEYESGLGLIVERWA